MIHGTLLLDKPKNITSNRALSIIKRELSVKKAGIVGILDPLASGMLPIVLNEGTKLAKFIESYEKEYQVIAKLGLISTTGDGEGDITKTEKNNPFKLTTIFIQRVLKSFIGKQKQIPPMYSGLKVNGVKLYDLARKGISIERNAREINIIDIKLISYKKDELCLNIICSKGTYIRTLVEMIGEKLNTGAYTKDLRRLRIGHFLENQMVTLDDLSNNMKNIIHINDMLNHVKSAIINEFETLKINSGQPISTTYSENYDEIAIKDKENNLLGIGRVVNGYIYPKRLINFNK
ncbi:tRNA pseudouridine(55) synthase TruB [Gammaproteobacteria bacterium]|nr:tRNA pseudouridine(55) synthase TruB [Gammaproteobacteria bacterium]